MSLLTDLVLHVVGSTLAPSSNRGIVAALSVGSIVLAGTTVWLLVTSADPIRQPDWGGAVLIGSVLCGAAGVLVSLLHVRRSQSDRLFAVLNLLVNATALATPLIWMIAQ
jgi:fermentation-respiration switch protein FrsA (DUF1100 family)